VLRSRCRNPGRCVDTPPGAPFAFDQSG
jgi:hypothetical protein